MKKLSIAVSLSVGLFSGFAAAEDACTTVLCLGGTMLGGDGQQMCQQPIQDFFDIKKYRGDGKFSASKTSKARKEFLDECEEEKEGNKAMIIAQWGGVEGNPY